MDKLIQIEKKKFNKLRRKFYKLVKNMSNLEPKNFDINTIKQTKLINSNIECLINSIDLCNQNIITKNKNMSKKLKNKIKNDEDIDKIIELFLPYMFLYQLNQT